MATVILIVILAILFIIGVVAILTVLFYPIVKDSQCPRCRRFWASKHTGEEFLGVFDKGINLYPPISLRPVRPKYWGINRFEKYDVLCQCRYCGNQWRVTKVREL